MYFPFITYGIALYATVYKNTNIEKIYEYASERAWKIIALKKQQQLLFLTNTINEVAFYYLWYGAINDSIPKKKTH